MNGQELTAITSRISAQLCDSDLKVFLYDQIDSTSDECKRKNQEGIQKCLVMAGSQSKGRGRTGKKFLSPEGGLYFSLSFPADYDPGEITCRAAVETAEAIELICGKTCGIKWVNDLFYQGKKVCGILAESLNNNIIIGIGINLQTASVPEPMKEIIGYLNCPDLREELVVRIVSKLLRPSYDHKMIMEQYRERSIILGKDITYTQGANRISARAVSIDDHGGLKIIGPNGIETLYFGEVSIRG